MNSRNPLVRWTKAPLSLENWENTLIFFNQARQFLQSLTTQNGTPLYQTKRFIFLQVYMLHYSSEMKQETLFMISQTNYHVFLVHCSIFCSPTSCLPFLVGKNESCSEICNFMVLIIQLKLKIQITTLMLMFIQQVPLCC